MEGKTINGYTLIERLGLGGMAEVWYAENVIGEKAAVKILLPNFCKEQTIITRFHTEAKIMVELDHPNIRQIYNYGDIDGRPAMVMEYLEGDDLKSRMKKGERFSDANLRKWWNQLVDALNYTHSKGIVHRDIKPGNIFVDTKGNIKLLDFGIAKIKEDISVTLTGQVFGTLIFMSPEQVHDTKHVDYRSDIYSLAVTFVNLITGKSPYDIDTSSDFEIRQQIVYKPLNMKDVPAGWRKLLEPYLAKDPAKRPALKHYCEERKRPDLEDTIGEDKKTEYKKHQDTKTNSKGDRRTWKNLSKSKKTLIKILIVIILTPILSWVLVVLPEYIENIYRNVAYHNKYTSVYSIYVSGNDVYAAGSVCSGSSTTDVPTLWINGVAQTVGNKGNFNMASSVFVSGNDVYVAVTDREAGKAILWKNGETQVLGDGVANSVIVNNGDVYVTGRMGDAAVVWINGTPNFLDNNGTANSIVVYNNDIYIAGCIYEESYYKTIYNDNAVIWKNSEKVLLGEGRAKSVYVTDEGDVYIVGENRNNRTETAVLWKNGEMQELQGIYNPETVFVSDEGNVYITGRNWMSAAIWIDGICYTIEDKIGTEANALYVDENTIYVGGNSKDGIWPVWKCAEKDFNVDALKRVETADNMK